MESLRRNIIEEKEAAHKAYTRERSDRESQWFNGRVSEIQKLTLRGIQPNIERLVRKHKQECEEIKCKSHSSKQKLEIQCENDFSERVEAFRHCQQQSNSCIAQRNDLGHLLLREKNEHVSSLIKLKQTFMQEEEASKKMYEIELHALTKDHNAAISKVKHAKGAQSLLQQCSSKKRWRQQELESKLEHVGKCKISSRRTWEEAWMEDSRSRVEEINRQKMTDLSKQRESSVKDLIKSSIIGKNSLSSSINYKMEGMDDHQNKMELMKSKLDSLNCYNEELDTKILAITNAKNQLMHSIAEIEKQCGAINSKSNATSKNKDRKSTQKDRSIEDFSNRFDASLELIDRRKNDVEHEIFLLKEKDKMEISCVLCSMPFQMINIISFN